MTIITPTAIPAPGFIDFVLNPKWAADNIGQILGPGIGAFLAFYFGIIIQKGQDKKEAKKIDVANAKQEFIYLAKINESIINMKKCIEDARDTHKRMNCYYFSKYSALVKEFEGYTYGELQDSELADNFEILITLAKRMDGESAECHDYFDNNYGRPVTKEEAKVFIDKYENSLSDAENLISKIERKYVISIKRAKKTIGLKEEQSTGVKNA